MRKPRFYGKGLPGFKERELNGLLLVLEGGDGAGRTTQASLLQDWLEGQGFPTRLVGLKHSELVGDELHEATRGNQILPLARSLFYATDFADQLEKGIIPALRAGFVVIADRYIYTLMARDIARGADAAWVRDLYGFALVPDQIFLLRVSPKALAERSLLKDGDIDFWEAGMDIQRSGDVYECFVRYQGRIQSEFRAMEKRYNLISIDANRDPLEVHADITARVSKILRRGAAAGPASNGHTLQRNSREVPALD